VGNHDVGFHYDMTSHKLTRFNKSFSSLKKFIHLYKPTQIRKRSDINFILVNSMALENDGCGFCKRAQNEIKQLNTTLDCLKNHKSNKECENIDLNDRVYSRPIVFSHFPLYRESDSICPTDIDSEYSHINKNPVFRSKYDCLSKEATNKLIDMLNPRLVFDGHTHYSCFNDLNGVPEYTLASFSWRNIKTPSLLMVNKLFR
jgi:hypothetical protein